MRCLLRPASEINVLKHIALAPCTEHACEYAVLRNASGVIAQHLRPPSVCGGMVSHILYGNRRQPRKIAPSLNTAIVNGSYLHACPSNGVWNVCKLEQFEMPVFASDLVDNIVGNFITVVIIRIIHGGFIRRCIGLQRMRCREDAVAYRASLNLRRCASHGKHKCKASPCVWLGNRPSRVVIRQVNGFLIIGIVYGDGIKVWEPTRSHPRRWNRLGMANRRIYSE